MTFMGQTGCGFGTAVLIVRRFSVNGHCTDRLSGETDSHCQDLLSPMARKCLFDASDMTSRRGE
jgi:hypothetical protein